MATRTRRITELAAQDKAAASRLVVDANAVIAAPDAVLITSADSPFTPEATDGFVFVDASGGAVTIALPALADTVGVPLTIKKTDSSGNAVTIDGDGSEAIDGATTKTLAAQWDSVSIYPEPASRWLILAEV